MRRRLTDAVTSLAAQAFPPSRRVVRDCARDAIDAAGLHLLPRPKPEPTPITTMTGPGQDPIFEWGPPCPYPWIPESEPLVTGLGLALLVAVAYSWGAARRRPEAALATALVLVSVAYPVAWKLHGYAIWPTILVPLGAATALTLRAAHAVDPPPRGGSSLEGSVA